MAYSILPYDLLVDYTISRVDKYAYMVFYSLSNNTTRKTKVRLNTIGESKRYNIGRTAFNNAKNSLARAGYIEFKNTHKEKGYLGTNEYTMVLEKVKNFVKLDLDILFHPQLTANEVIFYLELKTLKERTKKLENFTRATLATELGLSRPTLNSYIDKLEDLKLINLNCTIIFNNLQDYNTSFKEDNNIVYTNGKEINEEW